MIEKLPLPSPLNCAPVYFTSRATSTMDVAAGLADEGAPFGTVIQADYQTHGRGRRPAGVWESPAGKNLLFTVLLEKETAPALLLKTPLLIGLAVAKALENRYGLRSLIKWPNDVLVDGKKLCGILCRTRGRYILAGIGINCNQRRFSQALKAGAVSLALLLGRDVDRRDLLLSVIESYAEIRYQSYWREEIGERLAFRGERRVFRPEGDRSARLVEGVVEGLGGSGELLLRLPDGKLEKMFSGRLS